MKNDANDAIKPTKTKGSAKMQTQDHVKRAVCLLVNDLADNGQTFDEKQKQSYQDGVAILHWVLGNFDDSMFKENLDRMGLTTIKEVKLLHEQ